MSFYEEPLKGLLACPVNIYHECTPRMLHDLSRFVHEVPEPFNVVPSGRYTRYSRIPTTKPIQTQEGRSRQTCPLASLYTPAMVWGSISVKIALARRKPNIHARLIAAGRSILGCSPAYFSTFDFWDPSI